MTLAAESVRILKPYRDQKVARLPVSTGVFRDTHHGSNGFHNGVNWKLMLDYVEQGNNAQEWRNGRAQFAEIAVSRLLQTWVDCWHYDHRTLFTSLSPLSLDNSFFKSRGFDIYQSADTRENFGDGGKRVQEIFFAYDVTTGQGDHLDRKRSLFPANIELGFPVFLIPVRELPDFLQYLEGARLALKNGGNTIPFLFGLTKEEERVYHQHLTRMLVKEVDRVHNRVCSAPPDLITDDQRSKIYSHLAFFHQFPLREAQQRH